VCASSSPSQKRDFRGIMVCAPPLRSSFSSLRQSRAFTDGCSSFHKTLDPLIHDRPRSFPEPRYRTGMCDASSPSKKERACGVVMVCAPPLLSRLRLFSLLKNPRLTKRMCCFPKTTKTTLDVSIREVSNEPTHVGEV
jgi:hypothetical protein